MHISIRHPARVVLIPFTYQLVKTYIFDETMSVLHMISLLEYIIQKQALVPLDVPPPTRKKSL